MIRHATLADRTAVLEACCAYVRATPYSKVLQAPEQHAGLLFDLACQHGVLLVDDVAGEVKGCIVVVFSVYMGAILAEEVAWWHHTSPRQLLALAKAAERQAVQKGATVLKMSAPAWTSLESFYTRHGFERLETVYVKVLSHGSSSHRRLRGQERPGVGRVEADKESLPKEGRPRRSPRRTH